MTPLFYALCITVLGSEIGDPRVLLALFVLSVVLITIGKVFRPFASMFLRVTLPIAVPMLLIHSLFSPDGRTVLWTLGPLTFKQEGLMFAVSVTSRLMAMVSAYFLLVLVTHPRDLVIALESRKVPPKVGYLVLSTLQLIPYMQRTAETILDAQRSRGLRMKGSLLKRFQSYVPLLAPLVMGSISSLEIRAMALEVRGFNLTTPRTYLHQLVDTPLDRALRKVMVLLTLALIVGYYTLHFGRSIR